MLTHIKCETSVKRMQHLSIWILLLLFVLTSCANDEENVTVCANETASFVWDYDAPPFFAVEWFFETTPIAETLKEDFSPESLSIKGIYKSRFYLLDEKFGFNLTNVTWDDRGEYKCRLILQSTEIHELSKILIVKDCNTRGISISSPGDRTTTPTLVPAEDHTARTIVLAVVIPLVVVIGVLFGLWIYMKKKRRSERDIPEAATPMRPVNT